MSWWCLGAMIGGGCIDYTINFLRDHGSRELSTIALAGTPHVDLVDSTINLHLHSHSTIILHILNNTVTLKQQLNTTSYSTTGYWIGSSSSEQFHCTQYRLTNSYQGCLTNGRHNTVLHASTHFEHKRRKSTNR